MVRIRLVRVGRKHKPTYRIMVADSRAANQGRFIDNIGHCNPRAEPEVVVIDAAKAAHWLSRGAQPSAAVARLLKAQRIVDENGAVQVTADAPAEDASPEPDAGA